MINPIINVNTPRVWNYFLSLCTLCPFTIAIWANSKACVNSGRGGECLRDQLEIKWRVLHQVKQKKKNDHFAPSLSVSLRSRTSLGRSRAAGRAGRVRDPGACCGMWGGRQQVRGGGCAGVSVGAAWGAPGGPSGPCSCSPMVGLGGGFSLHLGLEELPEQPDSWL